MTKIILACVVGMLLVGCQTVAKKTESITPPKLEPIVSVAIENGLIEFGVTSFGCTEQAHFKLQLEGQAMTLQRLKPDHCRRSPGTKMIKFAVPKTGDAENYLILNPIKTK